MVKKVYLFLALVLLFGLTFFSTAVNASVNAEIIDVKIDGTNYIETPLGTVKLISVKIKNNGTDSHNFTIGLTIGEEWLNTSYGFNGTFCNGHNVPPCYYNIPVSGGNRWYDKDYSYVYLPPNFEGVVERSFIFRPEFFEMGNILDIAVAVFNDSFLPATDALDLVVLEDAVKINAKEADMEVFVPNDLKNTFHVNVGEFRNGDQSYFRMKYNGNVPINVTISYDVKEVGVNDALIKDPYWQETFLPGQVKEFRLPFVIPSKTAVQQKNSVDGTYCLWVYWIQGFVSFGSELPFYEETEYCVYVSEFPATLPVEMIGEMDYVVPGQYHTTQFFFTNPYNISKNFTIAYDYEGTSGKWLGQAAIKDTYLTMEFAPHETKLYVDKDRIVMLETHPDHIISVGGEFRLHPYWDEGVIAQGEPLGQWAHGGLNYTVNVTQIPDGGDVEIMSVVISDEVLAGEIVPVKIKVKNTGTVPWDFVVGMTIGKGWTGTTFTGDFCNMYCYADNVGPYLHTGILEPDDQIVLKRMYKFDPDYLPASDTYTLVVTVAGQEYLTVSQVIDIDTSESVKIIDVPPAKAIKVVPSRINPEIGGKISYTAYIQNLGSEYYNYTLGMSIGKWDFVGLTTVESGPGTLPVLVPPCNTNCYTDCVEYNPPGVCKHPAWKWRLIPPNETAFFTRTFRIPEYFNEDATFDIGIGIWYWDISTGKYKPVSVTYFKNVSVASGPTGEMELADQVNEYALRTGTAFERMTGWSMMSIKMFIWVLVLVLSIGGILAKTGGEGWLLALAVVVIMLGLGSMIGFIPWWIFLVVIVLVAMLFASSWTRVIHPG